MNVMDTIPLDKLQAVVKQAEEREAERVLEEVCKLAGIGVRTLQSRERTADTARRRAVVVWILCDRVNWPQAKAARATGRTVRQIKRLLRKERVVSPPPGN